MSNWTSKEVERLIELFPTTSNSVLSLLLGRSVIAIYKKSRKLKLKKTPELLFRIRSESRTGEKSSSWKGGRRKTNSGYIILVDRSHPNSTKAGIILEHRIIMEKHIGRYLLKEEVVHHINGVRDDNSIDNLKLMFNGEHIAYHNKRWVRTSETKLLMSVKAKERFKDERNHPSYKDINIVKLMNEVSSGKTIKQVCIDYGISNRTYYNKKEKWLLNE
jgi:hypothetical protein